MTQLTSQYNLQGDALKHCIDVSKASRILVDTDYVENVQKIELDKEIKRYIWSDDMSKGEKPKDAKDFTVITADTYAKQSDERIPDKARAEIAWKDPICFIYTSGTSGLPKAAPCSQAKFVTAGMAYANYWCVDRQCGRTDDAATFALTTSCTRLFLCVRRPTRRG